MDNVKMNWMGDDPLGSNYEARQDKFDRASFAQNMVNIINRVERNTTSAVFGLVGPWGSGKTSLIAMIRSEIVAVSRDRGWLIADFNPWAYGDLLALKAGFFAELRSAMPEDTAWKDRGAAVGELAERAAPLGALLGLLNVDGHGALSDAAARFKEASASKVHERAAAALVDAGQPILVIIDDLDRLAAPEVLEVFKLVRLIGRLPNVYYLLSYDEQTLIDLISKTDLVGDASARRATEYLEKIVQIRFDIPELRQYQVDQAVDEGIEYLTRTAGGMSRDDLTRINSIFQDVLKPRMTAPRAIRRYFAQVDAFLAEVAVDVNLADFLVLTWIRTFEPGMYRWIQRRKSELLGSSRITLRSLAKEGPEPRRARWLTELREARVNESDLEDMLWTVGQLFPAAHQVFRNTGIDSSSEPQLRSIANADYFDRYFRFGVPTEDISDSLIDRALAAIGTGQSHDALSSMNSKYETHPQLILRKIMRIVNASPMVSSEIAGWLRDRYLNSSNSDFWGSREMVPNVLAQVLLKIDESELARVHEYFHDDAAVWLFADAHRRLANLRVGSQDAVERSKSRSATLQPYLVERMTKTLEAHFNSPLVNIPPTTWQLIYYWNAIDSAQVRAALETAVAQGAWSRLDILARSLNSFLPHSGADDMSGRLDFDIVRFPSWVDPQLTLREVKDVLHELDSAENPDVFDGELATWANRRALALQMLKRKYDPDLEEQAPDVLLG